MDFSTFDVVVIILIALLGLKGLFRGFVKEIFGLLGIVGGVFFASKYSHYLTEQTSIYLPSIKSATAIELIAFVVTFLIFWISTLLLANFVKKLLSVSGLGFLDRLGGALVGSAKIFLIFAIIAYAMGSIGFVAKRVKPKLNDSVMFPILFDAGSYIIHVEDNENLEGVQKAKENFAQGIENLKDSAINSLLDGSKTFKDLSSEEIKTIKNSIKNLSPEEKERFQEKLKDLPNEDLEKFLN